VKSALVSCVIYLQEMGQAKHVVVIQQTHRKMMMFFLNEFSQKKDQFFSWLLIWDQPGNEIRATV